MRSVLTGIVGKLWPVFVDCPARLFQVLHVSQDWAYTANHIFERMELGGRTLKYALHRFSCCCASSQKSSASSADSRCRNIWASVLLYALPMSVTMMAILYPAQSPLTPLPTNASPARSPTAQTSHPRSG